MTHVSLRPLIFAGGLLYCLVFAAWSPTRQFGEWGWYAAWVLAGFSALLFASQGLRLFQRIRAAQQDLTTAKRVLIEELARQEQLEAALQQQLAIKFRLKTEVARQLKKTPGHE